MKECDLLWYSVIESSYNTLCHVAKEEMILLSVFFFMLLNIVFCFVFVKPVNIIPVMMKMNEGS